MGTDAPRVADDTIVAERRSRVDSAMSLALVAYAVTLAAIAFWPTPVDRAAGPFLSAIRRVVPWLTYDVIEFGANVMMFVPFGVILAVLLRRRRVLVLPIALAATVSIEIFQTFLLDQRTGAVSDVLANVLGAAGGLGVVVLVEWMRRLSA